MDAKKLFLSGKRNGDENEILQINLPRFLEFLRTNAIGRLIITPNNEAASISSLMQRRTAHTILSAIRYERPELLRSLGTQDSNGRNEDTTDIVAKTRNTILLGLAPETQEVIVRLVVAVGALLASFCAGDPKEEKEDSTVVVRESQCFQLPDCNKRDEDTSGTLERVTSTHSNEYCCTASAPIVRAAAKMIENKAKGCLSIAAKPDVSKALGKVAVSGKVSELPDTKKYRPRQRSPKARKPSDCGDRYKEHECINCYEKGHVLRLCPHLTYQQQNMHLTCYRCSQRGHVEYHCPNRNVQAELDALEIGIISSQNKVKQYAESIDAQLDIALAAIHNLVSARYRQLEADVDLRCNVAQRDFVQSHGNPAYPTRDEVLARHAVSDPLATKEDEEQFRILAKEMLKNLMQRIIKD